MNWRASLSAAVIVALAGLAVGVAIGGKTKTTSGGARTITVTKTITTTTGSGGTSTTGSSTSTSGGGGQSASQEYYSDYLTAQSNNNDLNTNGTNASLDSSPTSLVLEGQTYQHAVAFDLSPGDSNGQLLSMQLPIPGFTHFSASLAGLATDDSARATYKLTIYKNNDNPGATVLYTATFTGPSGTHPINFDTHGATDIVLDWTQPSSGEPDSSDQFIIADPVVTTG